MRYWKIGVIDMVDRKIIGASCDRHSKNDKKRN